MPRSRGFLALLVLLTSIAEACSEPTVSTLSAAGAPVAADPQAEQHASDPPPDIALHQNPYGLIDSSGDPGFFAGGGSPEKLLKWLRSHGGVAHLEVGETCPGCMRGTLATRDLERGDLVASVPAELVIDIGPRSLDVGTAAAAWARKLRHNATYAELFAPFTDTLPGLGSVLSPEMWPHDLVRELQSPELQAMVDGRIFEAERVWREAGFSDGWPVGGNASLEMPLGAFKHLVACIATRMYSYPSAAHGGEDHMRLLAVFDMANCADEGLAGPRDGGSNAEVQHPLPDGTFTMLARRRIRKGEEVTNNYGHVYLHRPDMALLVYGFVPSREPPVLAVVDLPAGFGEVEHPMNAYPSTPTLEPDYGNPDGEFTTEAELRRLAGIYAGLPTTLAEDQQLLAAEVRPHWQLLLRWRVARKRALLAAITQLSASLAARHQVWPGNPNYEPPAPGGASREGPADPPADLPDGSAAADGGVAPRSRGGGGNHDEL